MAKNRMLTAIGAVAVLSLTACTAPSPTNPPSSPTSESPTSNPPTESSAPASATPEELTQRVEKFGIVLMLPEGWSIEPGEYCEGDCNENEYGQWDIRDANGEHAMYFAANSATSPDGDTNLYQRTILTKQPAPNLKYKPTSRFAEYWVSEDQEDGERSAGLDIALVDDEVLAKRGEAPDISYFQLNDRQAPMFGVLHDYVEEIAADGEELSEEQAQKFLSSSDYATLEAILLSLRQADQ
ncbi:hypothetical protein GCM10027417_13440 [Glutamicibacter endophyticus]